MTETWVDLTYRGVALGRRVKLTEIRPTTGYVELPAPMPVGSELGVTTDDGLAFTATVAWIHEQVGGVDRTPGMIVSPVLAEPAAAWWAKRVALPDEPVTTPRPVRSRPVTLRPRSRTNSSSLKSAGPTGPADSRPAVIADLNARVAAAAGVAPALVMPPVVLVSAGAQAAAEVAAVPAEPRTQTDRGLGTPVGPVGPVGPVMRRTGEHAVVDDGQRTVIMEAVDPHLLGLDLGRAGSVPGIPLPPPEGDGATDPEGPRHRDSDDDDEPEMTVLSGPPEPGDDEP